jgi:stage II sporulation protein D
VGLVLGQAEARFQALAGNYVIREAQGDQPIAVAAVGEPWAVVGRGGTELRVVDPRGYVSQAHERPVRVEPLAPDSLLAIGERRYAGALEVLADPAGLTLVNELPLEQYLRGVLPHELRAGQGALEALRAQAIAARTYALKRMGSRAELGFDVFADVQDQVYGGSGDATVWTDRALTDTRGRVLLAGDLLVDAYYHSTCGGATAALEESFPYPGVPYLISVNDRDRKGGYYCSRSRYFRWQATYARSALERLFARNLARLATLPSIGLGLLVDITIGESSRGGRVLALRIETSTGSYQVVRGDVRWLFADEGSPGLRSTLFLLRKDRLGGLIQSLTLTGGGWGHGVGMCQIGALGRAEAGAEHEDILAYYYRGTRVERLYE